ncbi:beta-galactoside alpha-2,6-sialyltransferase 2-like [Protopterus annectens]|uniref:beta-galactoside alpha-2,6-sialyltransferase 2-like n=1 Tax=Protopterus annectens TaxID=7888 RepID=UPI001CF98BD3|nr:beta-galactoside alpha-2,6-sialyltransferase 2-like [Protopterus annectens]
MRPNLKQWKQPVLIMRPALKQWKQLMLIGMFVWAVLFLGLFVYFLGKEMVGQAPSALTYVERKGLASIQGKQRAIMGAKVEASFSERAEDTNSFLFIYEMTDSFSTGHKSFKPEVEMRTLSDEKRHFNENAAAAGQPKLQRKNKEQTKSVFKKAEGLLEHRKTSQEFRKKKREQVDDSLHLGDYATKSECIFCKMLHVDFPSKMLSPRLQKAMRAYLNDNSHGVKFKGKRNSMKLIANELLCELKHWAKVRTVDGKDPPFSLLGWEKHVPRIPLTNQHPHGFRHCAVVSSAGALLNSSLGKEIGRYTIKQYKISFQAVDKHVLLRIFKLITTKLK